MVARAAGASRSGRSKRSSSITLLRHGTITVHRLITESRRWIGDRARSSIPSGDSAAWNAGRRSIMPLWCATTTTTDTSPGLPNKRRAPMNTIPEVRITTAGHSGEWQECVKRAAGPLAVVGKRVTGPAGYTTEMDVGECCQPRLVREYREQAERGEVKFIDARTTGPNLPRYH